MAQPARWVGALAVLVIALESAAHAIAAMIRGGSIGRDIDAIAGHPRAASEDDWTVIAGFGFALFLG
ncbi:hypothetical protein, partial [Bradyrhizobium sp. NBAIM08]|uniref:hypothetical protein n=1 Tax=Bradyrhizobium sp. NBAIM08 TaxID=2793815 RepID=UPI001CD3A8E7